MKCKQRCNNVQWDQHLCMVNANYQRTSWWLQKWTVNHPKVILQFSWLWNTIDMSTAQNPKQNCFAFCYQLSITWPVHSLPCDLALLYASSPRQRRTHVQRVIICFAQHPLFFSHERSSCTAILKESNVLLPGSPRPFEDLPWLNDTGELLLSSPD